jgi:hypothetical protein
MPHPHPEADEEVERFWIYLNELRWYNDRAFESWIRRERKDDNH